MTTLPPDQWTFRPLNLGEVVRVIDGDTVEMRWEMDLGFGDTFARRRPFRLLGVNAPERYTETGKAAKAFLIELLPPGTMCALTSVRVDKYAPRFDAILTLTDGRDVADVIIKAGHGVPYLSSKVMNLNDSDSTDLDVDP